MADPEKSPKYRQVAQQIYQLIHSGQVAVGQALPSEQEFSRRFDVSYLTVRRANDELERLGVISRQRGRGTFVISRGENRVRRIGYLAVERELVGSMLDEFQAIKARLAGAHYRMMFDCLQPHRDQQVLPPSLAEASDLTALVVSGPLDESYQHRLAQLDVPAIVFGNCPPMSGLGRVEIDFRELAFQFTRLAMEQMGFDRVWLVVEPMRLYYSRQLLEGYRQAIADAPRMPELVSLCDSQALQPFINHLRHERQHAGGRHAVLWTHRAPFPSFSRMGLDFAAGELGVVNIGQDRLPGWELPEHFDLGSLGGRKEIMVEALHQALERIEHDPSARPWLRMVPRLTAAATVGGSGANGWRVQLSWRIETVR